MSEIFKLRMTAEQKSALFSASAEYTGGASEFWREYSVYTAELLVKLQDGYITLDELGDNIASYIQEHVITTAEHPDEP